MAMRGQALDREVICTILVSAYYDTHSLKLQKLFCFLATHVRVHVTAVLLHRPRLMGSHLARLRLKIAWTLKDRRVLAWCR